LKPSTTTSSLYLKPRLPATFFLSPLRSPDLVSSLEKINWVIWVLEDKSSNPLLLKTSHKISKRTLHFMLTSRPVNSSIAAAYSLPSPGFLLHVFQICSSNSAQAFFLFCNIFYFFSFL
jgi:hypothetical protein